LHPLASSVSASLAPSLAPSAALLLASLALAACGDNSEVPPETNQPPAFLRGEIRQRSYDGATDDLLTAGLGKTGLAGAAPVIAQPAAPTEEELRRLAIYNNYRALVDITANGGYGTLYGPNVDANGVAGAGEGKIGGDEYLAYADDGTGRQNVALMVQIPSTFDKAHPCIVTATSSGSRGVYGAIATAGEWGLKHGCAVAYTDKGSGNGGHDLAANTAYGLTGTRATVDTLGKDATFAAAGTEAERAAYNTQFPNRWAYKHAHSQQNPEKDWGKHTLWAAQLAFYLLNEKYSPLEGDAHLVTITRDNTIVIASSVSNGGGAALAAVEQDNEGWIDGLAVGEPQVQLDAPAGLQIRRGATSVTGFGKSLYDYFTLANLLQPCAAHAAAAGSVGLAFVPLATATNRCTQLVARGLVNGVGLAEQSADALAKLHAAGWEPEADPLHATHYALATLSVTLTYANAYARAGVRDNLCGYSFGGAPAAGVPAQLSANAAAQLFGTGNGVPPTSGINVLNNDSLGGAALDAASVNPVTGLPDFNATGATCLRELLTGQAAAAKALRAGLAEVKRTGDLHGKPAVIVHGRSDTLIPVNHTSRPYYALNQLEDGSSRLRYYEVTNAQHFDGFLGNAALAGYDTRLVPLHRYFNQAMDLVYAHLTKGTPLPASQVVRTQPRGGVPGAAPAITAANVPPIAASPAAADAITFDAEAKLLVIPD
jgi:hydroxybutyrate-dimer hydrolase